MASLGSAKNGRVTWILGGGALLVAFLGVLAAVFLPLVVTWWLGGDDFRRLASQQLSRLLQTEGDLEPLAWSSFSVYSGGFSSRQGARGPWQWELRELRTEISPRLLLDRILRFSEISIGEVRILPGTLPPLPQTKESAATSTGKASADLFRDVQVGEISVRSLKIAPCEATGGWGLRDTRVTVQPGKQQTDFSLQGGEIQTPASWLQSVRLETAKGRYTDPTFYLTSFRANPADGGSIELSGEYTPGSPARVKGQIQWDQLSFPGARIGLGIAQIEGRISGNFTLKEMAGRDPTGDGRIQLVDGRLRSGPGLAEKSLFWLIAKLANEPRLENCPITEAVADISVAGGGIYELKNIVFESPGLLRMTGKVGCSGKNLHGELQLGLTRDLGRKINLVTGGQCFGREEDGYLYEPFSILGTFDQPRNNLAEKLGTALVETGIQKSVDFLQKATGNADPNSPAGAAGRVLNSIFGSPGR